MINGPEEWREVHLKNWDPWVYEAISILKRAIVVHYLQNATLSAHL